MAKDPVCNMMVDEKKARHIYEVMGRKSICVQHTVRVSLIKILTNMDTKVTHTVIIIAVDFLARSIYRLCTSLSIRRPSGLFLAVGKF